MKTYFVYSTGRSFKLPGRTINVAPVLERYEQKHGVMFPLFVDAVMDVSGTRAIVNVDEHWRSSTYLVERNADGSWRVVTIDHYIT